MFGWGGGDKDLIWQRSAPHTSVAWWTHSHACTLPPPIVRHAVPSSSMLFNFKFTFKTSKEACQRQGVAAIKDGRRCQHFLELYVASKAAVYPAAD